MELITIPFSHYCEKARWALDYSGLAYHETAYLPGLHLSATKKHGGKSVPVLIASDRVHTDSTDILTFIDTRLPEDRRLFPAQNRKDVEALEEKFDAELGPVTRVWAYAHLLPDVHKMVGLIGGKLSFAKRAQLHLLLPFVRPLIKKSYRIGNDSRAQSLERIGKVFADVDALLADGRTFLVGDRFSAADLTFAALAAPILAPPEHPIVPENRDLPVPPGMTDEMESMRATRAGAFALRMYREHRSP